MEYKCLNYLLIYHLIAPFFQETTGMRCKLAFPGWIAHDHVELVTAKINAFIKEISHGKIYFNKGGKTHFLPDTFWFYIIKQGQVKAKSCYSQSLAFDIHAEYRIFQYLS